MFIEHKGFFIESESPISIERAKKSIDECMDMVPDYSINVKRALSTAYAGVNEVYDVLKGIPKPIHKRDAVTVRLGTFSASSIEAGYESPQTGW